LIKEALVLCDEDFPIRSIKIARVASKVIAQVRGAERVRGRAISRS